MIFNVVTKERIESVKNAISIAFNTSVPEELSLLAGGYSSSQTYKMIIQNEEFVLRVMGLDQTLPDREQQVHCLHVAAEAGIAPNCYYADPVAGIVIMKYIKPQPKSNEARWLSNVAITLHHLHTLPTFPPMHQTLFGYMESLMNELQVYSLSTLLNNYLNKVREIQSILQPHLILISCHNDLNANNILFDGEKIYFIDWEAAGASDPFFDIATICNYIFEIGNEEKFLDQYVGEKLTDFQSAKLHLMKQVAFCFPAIHFLSFCGHSNIPLERIDDLTDIPVLLEWARGYGLGQYKLTTPQDFLLYALVSIKASLSQINSKQFILSAEKLK